MQILYATNNQAKVDRVRKLLIRWGVECITPAEAGIDIDDIVEGSDIAANAQLKALAYHGLTDLSILANDTSFTIAGETLDPAMVKRNALGDRDEASLSQEQIAELILSFYRKIVARHGGPVSAYWEDSFALVTPEREVRNEHGRRPVILTGEVRGDINPFFPMRSIYIVKPTGKYVYEQTEDEEAIELQPLQEALIRLLKLE